jgi:hypothetical protein
VDDGSSDATLSILEELAPEHQALHVVGRTENGGAGRRPPTRSVRSGCCSWTAT